MGAWLCTSSKNAGKSDRTLSGPTTAYKNPSNNTRTISTNTAGASTGITNAVRQTENIYDQTHVRLDSTPSLPFSSSKTAVSATNDMREGEGPMNKQSTTKISLAESQFYVRTPSTLISNRHDLVDRNFDEVCSSPPADDTYHDAIDDLSIHKDSTVIDTIQSENSFVGGNPLSKTKIAPDSSSVQSVEVVMNHLPAVQTVRPLSNALIINPFERLRPLNTCKEVQPQVPEEVSLKIFERSSAVKKRIDTRQEQSPFSSSPKLKGNHSFEICNEHVFDLIDDHNDSSTSTTTGRSIHLPVEKQRGFSEIIRKRNSRFKVEDYKRSIQKPTTVIDEDLLSHRILPTSKSDYELVLLSNQTSPSIFDNHHETNLSKTQSMNIPLHIEHNSNKQIEKMSIERLNVLLSTDDHSKQQTISNETEQNLSVADKRNLFENFSKDTQLGGNLSRTNIVNPEESSFTSAITKKYANQNQRSTTENILAFHSVPVENKPEGNVFDDDTSKLTFKEKMTLFNKKNANGLATSSSLKHNRNRLTQPITAEEVQAAANLTPTSSAQQLNKANGDEAVFSNPEDSESRTPMSTRHEQFREHVDTEWKQRTTDEHSNLTPISNLSITTELKSLNDGGSRKMPTLKYHTKKFNVDNEQRAKTVDIVRLKNETIIKSKDTQQIVHGTSNGTGSKSNQKIVSVLKSDIVTVLKPDDCIDEFFTSSQKNSTLDPSIQLNTDDLNHLAENTVRLQTQTARVRPPRRQQAGAKNPLRQIQATIPTENQYTEVHTNLSEQEIRRLKRAQIAETAGQAQEALASLATIENFAEVNLRKVTRSSATTFGFEPYKDLMLILIKGRRQCSLHLINPNYKSINEGDCYLLITPLKVFVWLGRYANSVEKSKTLDLVDYLKQNRDLGLRNETKFFILDQAKDDTENDIHAEFRDILHGEVDGDQRRDQVTDDDFYETNRIEFNRIYRVENDILMPLDEYCFRPLSIKILDPNQVFVFDFGSELYVWNGKYAEKTARHMGLQLAQQLWNDVYDFTDCTINPFDPLDDHNELPNATGTERPAWCLLGKQNQNVETLLFKGKFFDWIHESNEKKSNNESNLNVIHPVLSQRPLSIVETLKPADVNQMLMNNEHQVNMILEQTNLGRGTYWFDPVETRGYRVQTLSIHIWHVSENERPELPKSSYGQFHSDDVYLVRWRYKLVPLNQNQTPTQKPDIYRDRVAYWIWQGIHASPNERGISALMAVCLNEEKGPHIHVIQEHEEAAFLQLFDGTFSIHMGKRNHFESKSRWYLYVFRGEIESETHWWELQVNSNNLRSRTSFLLIHNRENTILLWHGYGTTDEQKKIASTSAMKLRDRCPVEFHLDTNSDNIDFYEMQEGDEIDLFWEAINEPTTRERRYHSWLNLDINQRCFSTMRIFHLSSLHGPFVAQELLYPLRSSDHVAPFPFTQADLYELHQPALCLIDAHNELYIWQGWNDLMDDELGVQLANANLLTGGQRDIRFTTERRCALRTIIEYCQVKTNSSTVDLPCSIVYAGLEPNEFMNLFPKWTVHKKARQQNQMEGKMLNQKDSVINVLNQLCRERYTVDELRARPLPEGVDPSKIESYLSDEDFQREFRMNKNEFYALPFWKQTNIKKPLGFF